MPKELYWLSLTLAMTALLHFPYVLNRLVRRGAAGAMGNPAASDAPLADWAQRAQRAHANAVENLVVFAPTVLTVHALGRGDALTAGACAVYFAARLAHYLIYIAGIPVARTVAYLVGWASVAVLLLRLLGMI